jgi:hypothetical protein
MAPSVDFSSSSGSSRVESDRINSVSLTGVLNESTSNAAAAQVIPQDGLEATKRMDSIATDDQAPNVDILRPSIESALELSKKRKRPTPKDPAKFRHECETCGERFTRSTTLREHSRTHNGERPFPCSICPKQFARSKDKIRHEALHAGEKQFYCDLSQGDIHGACGRGFAREDGLMAHLRTERGWKCLRIVIDDLLTTTDFAATFIDNGYCCGLTRLACRANFIRLTDLKEHLEDPANRRCVSERLVEIFVRMLRETRGIQEEHADPDDRSSTPSATGQQNISSSAQRSHRPQQETISPLPSPLSPADFDRNKIQLKSRLQMPKPLRKLYPRVNSQRRTDRSIWMR